MKKNIFCFAKKAKNIFLIFLLLASFFSVGFANQLTQIRNNYQFSADQFIFDLTQAPEYKSFYLKNPDRLVVDLLNVNYRGGFSYQKKLTSPVMGVRYSKKSNGDLRVVFDLKKSTKAKISILVKTSSRAQ